MKFHIVSSSENIKKIAFLYNMEVEEIQKENRHIRDFYNLLPGTKLKIPVLSENVMSEINEFEPFIEDYYPKYDLNDHIEEYVSENQKEDNNEYVNENAIAPSTEGYFDIKIDPTNVGLSFKYNIDFEIENKDIPDLMISKYAIIPNDFQEGVDTITYTTLDTNIITNELIFDKEKTEFQFEPFTVRLWFEWYEGEGEQMLDEDDAEIGSVAALETTKFRMIANIKFEQITK